MQGNDFPSWAHELSRKLNAGIAHCFILHFNVSDVLLLSDKKYSLLEFLNVMFGERDFVIHYDISGGIRFLKGDEKKLKELAGVKDEPINPLKAKIGLSSQGLSKGASETFPLFEKALTNEGAQKRVALILDYAQTLAPQEAGSATTSQDDRVNYVTLLRWAQDEKIRKSGHVVVLLTNDLTSIHSSLRAPDSMIEEIEVAKPGVDEREHCIGVLSKDYEEEMGAVSSKHLAYATAGLSLRQIEDLFLLARQSFEKVSLNVVKQRKYEILERQHKDEGLEFIDPIYGWNTVGGLSWVRDGLVEVLQAMEGGDWRRVPMGILFTGPPGTGKSHVAQVIAKELGFNFVMLGRVKDKFVGESEKKLSRVMRSVKSNVPIVWFIDEIGQILGRQDDISTDSGVSRAFLGEFLKFMSDTAHRGKILIIGATNRPDLLDSALKRPGRFDMRIPFLYPHTAEERADIFRAMIEKYRYECAISDFLSFVQRSFYDLWGNEVEINGADIENMVRYAYVSAAKAGRAMIDKEDIEYGIEEHVVSYEQNEIDHMTLAAIKTCSPRSLLPPYWKEVVKKIHPDLAKKISAPEEQNRSTPHSLQTIQM